MFKFAMIFRMVGVTIKIIIVNNIMNPERRTIG